MIISLIWLLLLFLNAYKKRKTVNLLPFFLVFYYFIACLIGNILYYLDAIPLRDPVITVESQLFFMFCISCFIIPWKYIVRFPNIAVHEKYKRKIFHITIVLIILNLISVVISLKDVIEVILTGNFGVQRNNIQETLAIRGFSISKMLNSYLSISYFFLISLYFYNLIYHRSNKFLALIMVASTSRILFSLSTVGRSGIVWWFLMFIANYLFFKNLINESERKKIKKQLVFFGTFFLVLFLSISFSRFGATDNVSYNSNTIYAILDYFSQGFSNFNSFYNQKIADYYYGGFNFPLFGGIFERLGFLNFDYSSIYDDFSSNYPYLYFTFNTFIADLYLDFGPIFTVLFSIVYYLLIRILFYKKKYYSVSDVFLLMFIIQLPLLGIFSSTWKLPESNLVLLLLIFAKWIKRLLSFNNSDYFMVQK